MLTKKFICYIIILLIAISCKKKQNANCPTNIDLSANFTIQQDLGFTDLDKIDRYTELNNDTVYLIKYLHPDSTIEFQDIRLRFRTSETNKKCEWTISGDPTIRKGYDIEVDFSGVFGTLQATCTKVFDPWKECFPDLTGFDTVKRNFHFVVKENPSFFGQYFGYNEDNPSDTFTIVIGFFNEQGHPDNDIISIGNFPKSFKYYQTGLRFSYSEFYFRNFSDGSAKFAHGYTSKNGKEIVIDYIHNNINSDNTITYVNRKFVGKKIK